MDHKPVESSNIESVGYDPDAKRLEVRFKGGQLWEYDDVDEATHADLLNADSVGKYFHAHIRPRNCRRIYEDADVRPDL